jgi:SAM-dependent methyltransferase
MTSGFGDHYYWVEQHYRIEKELAQRLRQAPRNERLHLYRELYEELFRRVPYHPMLTHKASASERQEEVSRDLRRLWPFLHKDATFLEIGAGDCALSFAVAGIVNRVYAVDVSETITALDGCPPNFELVLSDGIDVPVPPGTVNVAYSNQLMEHLHPDDALEQLQNVLRTLVPGGIYLCATPNRLGGPTDVSRSFDRTATGFHLKEYTVGELARIFRRVGFRRVRNLFGMKGHYALFWPWPFVIGERLLELLPDGCRRWSAGHMFPQVRLVGVKPENSVPPRTFSRRMI